MSSSSFGLSSFGAQLNKPPRPARVSVIVIVMISFVSAWPGGLPKPPILHQTIPNYAPNYTKLLELVLHLVLLVEETASKIGCRGFRYCKCKGVV